MKKGESRERACRRARCAFGKISIRDAPRARGARKNATTRHARANGIPEIIASRGGASKSAAASHKGDGAERGRVTAPRPRYRA